MSIKFHKAIERILTHEGGYVNDPNDPGGETKWGISRRSYPTVDIARLTRADAIAIYFRDFWKPLGGELFEDGVGFQLLDAAVNSGISNAVRFAQRAAGVADDGHLGPVSSQAIHGMSESDFILRFLAERLDFMTRLSNWPHHGKGWARRIAANLRLGAEDSE